MAYDGYLSLGANEIMNRSRTTAYLQRFLPTLDLRGCEDCEYMPNVTATTSDWHNGSVFLDPKSDDAPWYDPDDPDTANFYGLYPVGITGVDDATVAATVSESLGDGGFVTGVRRTTKEILVSALLVAKDEAAMSAGMAWLRVALDGSTCDPCTGDDLCLFSACPPVNPGDVFDPDGALVNEAIPLSSLTAENGTWDGSTFNPITADSALVAPEPVGYGTGDEVTYTWTVAHTVTVRIMDGLEVIAEATGSGTISVSAPADRYPNLHCDLTVPDVATVTVTSVIAQHHPAAPIDTPDAYLDPQVDPYRRTFRQVTCVSGPTVVEKYALPHGAMQRVEFMLVAATPWQYGEEREVASALISQVTPDTADPIYSAALLPLCTESVDPSMRFVRDPNCPPVPAPPRPAMVIEQCATETLTNSYVIRVPERHVPTWFDAVPVLTLRTGHLAAREIRVRMFPRPLPNQLPADLDLCSACMSFIVSYIPANATLTLDGMIEQAILERTGGRRNPVGHLLRGIDDAVFDWPALTCGMGYYVVVDTAPDALVELSLSLVVRK